MGTIMGEADGQPGWLKPWFNFWINWQHPRAMFFAYLVAIVETLIAVALIAGFARKITYIAAATFSVMIWAIAEGFGGPYTSGDESSYGWMMSAPGYQWMTGGASAPGWMRGGTLPGAMMGTSTDPGKIMGSLWANVPGPRVSAAVAATLGGQVPAGARIDRAAHTVTFAATTVRLSVLASPSGGPDETFRAVGMTNPAIVVPAGARVSIEVINADPDTAHGLVITASTAATWMPMMTDRPAFTGSALWFLGNPTSAGMHAGPLTFTATTPGSYRYLCPVPGHAQKGMAGAFTVR